MTNHRNLVKELHTLDHNTAITQSEFGKHFKKTKERVIYSFNGWEGKSYDGETRTAYTYCCTLEGYEDLRFIKVGKGLHQVDDSHLVLEKATGKKHKSVDWLINIIKDQEETKL